jgi:transcription elongation factor Elf1
MRHNSQQERNSYGKIACYSCGIPMRVKPGENCKIPSCHSDREGIRTFITCKTCGEKFTNEKSYMFHRLSCDLIGPLQNQIHLRPNCYRLMTAWYYNHVQT